jgi:putative membrane protein
MTGIEKLRRWFYGAMAAPATMGLAQTALADGQHGGSGGHMWGGGSMMFMGPFMMIIFLAIIVLVVFLIVKWLLPQPVNAASSGARAILDERFAKGDIDADEYAARRDVLDG